MPLEYTVLRLGGLDYRPEDWTPADSLAWLKAMAWDLRGNMDDEIERGLLSASTHTDAEVAELYPPYPYERHRPIVDQGAVVDGVFEQDATGGTRQPARPPLGPAARRRAGAGQRRRSQDLPAMLGQAATASASNAWVVDGDHSTTGEPILANDPHLGVSLPGIWYQMGLHCTTVSDGVPVRRRRLHLLRRARAWSSATTPRSPGGSPTSGPT